VAGGRGVLARTGEGLVAAASGCLGTAFLAWSLALNRGRYELKHKGVRCNCMHYTALLFKLGHWH
jgi:hypothetical protein